MLISEHLEHTDEPREGNKHNFQAHDPRDGGQGSFSSSIMNVHLRVGRV